MRYLVPFLLIVIVLLVGAVSFMAGKSGLKLPASIGISIQSPTPVPTPTPSAKPTQKVTGGGILSFPKYELTVPSDWTVTKEVPGPDSEKVILKNGGYEISILEGGFGGSICLYPGDADMEGPSARYEKYVEIKSKANDLFRRSWSGSGGYAICQMTQYGWNAPTLYGHISFKTPSSASAEMVSEMDAILASFNKI